MSLGFKDPRVNLRITDGIKWVTDAEEGTYDAIIVDSSDPVGPAEVLFEEVCNANGPTKNYPTDYEFLRPRFARHPGLMP